jgi:hypothetical protein
MWLLSHRLADVSVFWTGAGTPREVPTMLDLGTSQACAMKSAGPHIRNRQIRSRLV